jgi:hypothetical protein
MGATTEEGDAAKCSCCLGSLFDSSDHACGIACATFATIEIRLMQPMSDVVHHLHLRRILPPDDCMHEVALSYAVAAQE